MSNKSLPKEFKNWNHLYDTITNLFPGVQIDQDFQVALMNDPNMEKHLNDPDWLKENSDHFIFVGELKVKCFDEIAEQRFTLSELILLRSIMKFSTERLDRTSLETASSILDKLNHLLKLQP